MLGLKTKSKIMTTTSFMNVTEIGQSTPIYPGSVHEFNISSQNVRDEILKSLKSRFGDNNIAKRVINHMKQFHKKSLDGYSEFVIVLTGLANTRLEFRTTRMDGHIVDYLLDKYDSSPPENFTKVASLWSKLFGN